jgi:hypothetical protein
MLKLGLSFSDTLLKVVKMLVNGHMKMHLKVQYLMVIYLKFTIMLLWTIFIHSFFSNVLKMRFVDDYFLSRFPIVNLRLAQGGVRLAATLNRVFDTQLVVSM